MDREIRKSRGIPVLRLLPFVLLFVIVVIMSMDNQLFVECLGKPLTPSHGKFAAWARVIATVGCAPHWVFDITWHWILVPLLWLNIALSPFQIIWLKRHRDYWNAVRERETRRRTNLMSHTSHTLC